MGTTRTSNKDILSAIESQTAAISALVATLAGNTPAAQEPAPAVETAPSQPELPKVDSNYLAHMTGKVESLVANDGQERVLYIRRNGHGEVKLAYCLKSRWATLRDNGKIGAIKVIS